MWRLLKARGNDRKIRRPDKVSAAWQSFGEPGTDLISLMNLSGLVASRITLVCLWPAVPRFTLIGLNQSRVAGGGTGPEIGK